MSDLSDSSEGGENIAEGVRAASNGHTGKKLLWPPVPGTPGGTLLSTGRGLFVQPCLWVRQPEFRRGSVEPGRGDRDQRGHTDRSPSLGGGRLKRQRDDDLVKLAWKLALDDTVRMSKAFMTQGEKLWVHDGTFWLADTGACAGLFSGYMRRYLCQHLSPEKVNAKLVREFVDLLTSIVVSLPPLRVLELAGRDFEAMRNRARGLVVLRGGALDLRGNAPELHRWADSNPRKLLFFEDEVVQIDCPESIAGFGSHDDLLNVMRAAYPTHWPVVLELVLQTLQAQQHRRTLVITGPRKTLKTSVFSTFIRCGLTDIHCPVKVDSFLVSQRWGNTADSAPDKRAADRMYGRSLFRVVDEAERQNGKAKFSVHLASIRKQQAGTDSFTPPGTFPRSVPTRVLPLFVITTNDPLEELFTEIPRAMDQRNKIIVIDTQGSTLDETGVNYDNDIAKSVWAICDDCSRNPSKYSGQLCSLLCWWLSSPPERHDVNALIADCTIDAYLARRDAVRVGVADDERGQTLIEFLGEPEDIDNRDRIIVRVEGRGGLRRKDIYAKAGVDFRSGGKPATAAGDVVDDWMERAFEGTKSDTLPGGYVGYKGFALSR